MSETNKVLITGAGGAAGRATASFMKEHNVAFIVVDMNSDIGKEYPPKQFKTIPAASDRKFIPELLKITKKGKVKLLIPTVDEEFLPITENKKKFKEAGVKLVFSGKKTIENCKDKAKTISILEKAGIKVPRTIIILQNLPFEYFGSELGFPFLVKPRIGRGARGIKIYDQSGLEEYYKHEYDDAYIAQQFINGKEYDVNMFIHKGKVSVNQVLLKTKLAHGDERYPYGNAKETKLNGDRQIEALARKAAKAINAEGAIDLDVRKDNLGLPYLLEINPRIGANVLKAPKVITALLNVAGIQAKKVVKRGRN